MSNFNAQTTTSGNGRGCELPDAKLNVSLWSIFIGPTRLKGRPHTLIYSLPCLAREEHLRLHN